MAFRDDRFQEIRVPLTWTAAAATAVAVAAAGALWLGDQREARLELVDAPAYSALQAGFDRGAAPVGSATAAPVRWTGDVFGYIGGYFFAVSENRRLRERVAELERVRQEATALKNLNARYAALLRMRIEPPVASVGAHVVNDVRGPYQNARLIDAGTEKAIRIGQPVMTDVGLLGRVVGVTKGASRVLLLTDVSSRTPVMVERTNARAILTGDGSDTPRMDHMRGQEPVKTGDLVLSSGDGGVLPRGLPVGRALKGPGGTWRVRLFNQDAPMDVARVLLYRDFLEGVDRNQLAQSVMPPAPPMQPAAPLLTGRPVGAVTPPGGAPPAGGAAPAPRPAAAAPRPRPPAPRPAPPPPRRTPPPQSPPPPITMAPIPNP